MSEISTLHRAVYVRTAKTGCRSTASWLVERFGFDEACWHQEYRQLLKGREHWLWFTTVRAPYDRARSLWEWAIQRHRGDLFPGLVKLIGGTEFTPFLRWLAEGRPGLEELAVTWKWNDVRRGSVVFLSQHEYLKPILGYVWLYPFEKIPYCYRELPFVPDDYSFTMFPHLNRAPGIADPGPVTVENVELVKLWAPLDARLYKSALEDPRPPSDCLRWE